MLQHLPAGIGRLLRNFRPYQDELMFHDPSAAAPDTVTVTSAALTGAALHRRPLRAARVDEIRRLAKGLCIGTYERG